MSLPQDAFVLLSLVNMKLRDGCSLEEICAEYDCSLEDICGPIEKIGYKYNRASNSFKAE